MADQAMDVYAAGTSVAGNMCWICQTRIMAGDEIVFCPHDKLPSHAECWEQNGGCPVYGCKAAPDYGQLAVQALGTQTGEANYHCPACHKTVKPNFLQCTFCGAPISLDSVVNNVEYDDYLFRVREDRKTRTALWSLFFAAATGILAPLVLIVAAVVSLRGTMGRIRMTHMMRESRTIYYSTILISALHALLLIVFGAFNL